MIQCYLLLQLDRTYCGMAFSPALRSWVIRRWLETCLLNCLSLFASQYVTWYSVHNGSWHILLTSLMTLIYVLAPFAYHSYDSLNMFGIITCLLMALIYIVWCKQAKRVGWYRIRITCDSLKLKSNTKTNKVQIIFTIMLCSVFSYKLCANKSTMCL